MIIVIKRGSSLVVMYKDSGTSSFREKSKLHGQSRAVASGWARGAAASLLDLLSQTSQVFGWICFL